MPITVDRALAALLAIQGAPKGLTISELANQLDVSVASASRLGQSLRQLGFLMRDETSGNQVLGLRLWELGGSAVARLEVRRVALPLIAEALPELKTRVNFALVLPDGPVGVDQLQLVNNLVLVSPNVRPVPYHATSIGKAVLAFSAKDVVDSVTGGPLPAFTEATITEEKVLLAELDTVRRTGIAFNRGESLGGGFGAAVPIRDSAGRPVAAINVATKGDVSGESSLAGRLIALGMAVSEELGFVAGLPSNPS